MSNFTKPIFSPEEIAETKSGRLYVGYKGQLIAGHDFSSKPFAGKFAKKFTKAKELLDGTAAKRNCHEKINSFGWARFDKNQLTFGVKYVAQMGLSKAGKSAIAKYEQWLGYLLEQAGWKDITVKKDLGSVNYVVPLNNAENISLLYTLSPSIGFFYKAKRPEVEDLRWLEANVVYDASKAKQEKTR